MASKVCCRLRVVELLVRGRGGGSGEQRLEVPPGGLYIQLHRVACVTRDCERWWWAPRPCCSGTLHPVLVHKHKPALCVGEIDL